MLLMGKVETLQHKAPRALHDPAQPATLASILSVSRGLPDDSVPQRRHLRPHTLRPPVSSTCRPCLNHPSTLGPGFEAASFWEDLTDPTLMAAHVFIMCLPACGPTQLLSQV